MSKAYLGIGGNMGDRRQYIERAVELLKGNPGITVGKVSSVYETEPVGYREQDWFLNIAAELDTVLSPYELLDYCGFIEKELKRERLIRWGPRTIDVDILLYEDVRLKDERLIIPHPRMKERAFVIIPLMEIAPDIVLDGEPIGCIAKRLDTEGVRKVKYAQE